MVKAQAAGAAGAEPGRDLGAGPQQVAHVEERRGGGGPGSGRQAVTTPSGSLAGIRRPGTRADSTAPTGSLPPAHGGRAHSPKVTIGGEGKQLWSEMGKKLFYAILPHTSQKRKDS